MTKRGAPPTYPGERLASSEHRRNMFPAPIPRSSFVSESETRHEGVCGVQNPRIDSQRPSRISASAVYPIARIEFLVGDTRQIHPDKRNRAGFAAGDFFDFFRLRKPQRPLSEQRRQRGKIDLSARPGKNDCIEVRSGAYDKRRSRLPYVYPEIGGAFCGGAKRRGIRKELVRKLRRVKTNRQRTQRRRVEPRVFAFPVHSAVSFTMRAIH